MAPRLSPTHKRREVLQLRSRRHGGRSRPLTTVSAEGPPPSAWRRRLGTVKRATQVTLLGSVLVGISAGFWGGVYLLVAELVG